MLGGNYTLTGCAAAHYYSFSKAGNVDLVNDLSPFSKASLGKQITQNMSSVNQITYHLSTNWILHITF